MSFLGFSRVDFPFSGTSTQFLSAIYPGTAFVDNSTAILPLLASYDEIRNIGGNLWFVVNATWDPTALTWRQVDPSKPSQALELTTTGAFAAFTAGAVGGITTNVPIVFTTQPIIPFATTNPLEKPAGRLTLTTGQPVMTADVVNTNTIFYTPYVGSLVPIFNGTTWGLFAFNQLSLILDAAHMTTGNVYDVFAFNNAGVISIAAGPAWATPSATRGTGAGTTQIQQQNGLWVNTVSVTAWNNSVSAVIPALQGTYLGSFFANGNAQVTMNFKPAGAAGGSNNILGLYNAYNRTMSRSMNIDSTAGSTAYAVGAWRILNNSAANRITFVDGLQQSSISATYRQILGINTNNGNPAIGIAIDSTTSSPGTNQTSVLVNSVAGTGEVDFSATVDIINPSLLGLHFLSAMQFSGISSLYYTLGGQAEILLVQLEM